MEGNRKFVVQITGYQMCKGFSAVVRNTDAPAYVEVGRDFGQIKV